MRIIVFSDSHGNYRTLREVVEKHQGDAGLFLHLGDGSREFLRLAKEFPLLDMRGVRGNCDILDDGEDSNMAFCGKTRIFYTHGHMFHVKDNLETLLENAVSLKADMALFGHTHRALSSYSRGVYLFNPGSIGMQGQKRSYGIIDLAGTSISPQIVTLK